MQRIGVQRRLSAFLTALLLASLLASFVPAGSVPEDAQAVGPPVYACANLYTGALRYAPSGTCSPNETLVNLNGEPSITVCASLYTGMLRYPFGGSCTPTERSLLLPGENATNLCVNRSTGRLRHQPNGSCPAGEGLVLIPQSNDPPTDIALAGTTVAENSPSGTLVGTLTATDPDPGDTFTFSLLDDAGGRFQIVGDQLQVADGTLLDFETDASHQITIQVADDSGATYSESFTIDVTDVNDTPTDIALSTSTVAENQPAGSAVGTLATVDQDVGDSFTYTLVAGAGDDDNASFQIVGDQLQTAAVFDFETQNSFSVRIRTTDSGGAFFEETFTITVTNVNEDPTGISLDNQSVAENQPVGTTVGTLTTSDPDLSDSFTYTLVAGAGDTDNGSFQIVGDQLQTNAVFDFETQNSFSVRIRSTDAGGLFVEAQFTLTVTDANDPPTDIALDNQTVAENEPAGTLVGTLSATDQDASETFTYALVAGAGDDDNASFQIVGDQLQTAALFDFETQSSFSIRVRVTDSGGATFEEVFTITVTDENEAPVVDDQSFGVDENSANGAVVGTVAASDPDTGQNLTYSITAGNTGPTFAIDANSGKITVLDNTLLDFETNPSFSLTVEVTDDGVPVLSDTATITINLNDVNEAPVVDDQTFGVDENSANGAVVGTVAASDPDTGQNLTYSITAGNTGPTFAIDANSGQITVLDNTLLDFETNPSFSLTVEVTDDGVPVLSDTATITINVNDVNEAPTVDDDTFTIPENSANGTSVGTVVATDPDTGQNLTFAITAGNGSGGGAFAINASSGEITVNDSAQLDFETTPTFTLTVTVTDDGAGMLSDTATIIVNLSDVNDAPVVDDQTFNVDENSANTTPVGTVVATDADLPAQNLTYAITAGDPGGAFAIDPNTGAITVADSSLLDFETTPVFSLTVEVTDDGAPPLSDTATITINLNDVNDAPVVNDQSFDVPENTSNGSLVATVAASDPDTGQALTYAITAGNTGATFAIDANTGAITVLDNTLLDFEAGNPPFSLTVEVTDNGAPPLSDTATVTITITDVNEQPTDIQLSDSDIEENSAIGTLIGTLTASDPDTGDTFTFTIQSDPDGKFQIVGDELQVGGALDFETDASHDVTIRVTDAGGLFFDELFTITVIDVNEAPLAVQDNYDAYTNTELAAGGATNTGLAGITNATDALDNDSDPDTNPAFNVIAIDADSGTSANGGTFSITADGEFSYTPPAGFSGVDTFTYTLRDNGPSGGLTATGTVQITVAGTAVWYVDTSEGANGDGTSTAPFNVIDGTTVNGGADVDAPNEIIYVATGGANSGALALEAGQRLIGQGVALDVLFLGNPTTIAAAGTRPTMGTTTLSTNNTVRGLNVSAATGITGADVDALILNSVGITSTSGAALNIAGGTAAMAVSIDSLTASSGANPGVQATGNAMGSLTITGATNTISSTTGTALNVNGTTIGAGGLVFQSISANGAANGIVLNTTGTTAGLTVTGDGSAGSGGTIQNITNRGASFISAADIELNWMTFTNAATTNGADPTNANSTCGDVSAGSNLGCNAPVHLASITGIGGGPGAILNQLTINGSAQVGLNLANVTGLTLTNVTISGIGNQVREHSIKGFNVAGTVTFTNVNASGTGNDDNVSIYNNAGTATMTVTGSTFNTSGAGVPSVGGDGFVFSAAGSAVLDLDVTTSNFNSNFASGFIAGFIDPGTMSTANADIDIASSSFNNNNAGIQVVNAGSADVTFDVTGITNLSGNPAAGIAIDQADNSTASASTVGTLSGNTITMPNSGSGNGIFFSARGSGTATILVTGNTITSTTQYGIHLHKKEGAGGTLNATVTNNNVTTNDTFGDLLFPIDGIRVEAGAASGDGGTVCANISANTVDGAGEEADAPGFDLKLRHRFGATFQVPGIAGTTATDAINRLNALNPAADTIDATTTTAFSNSPGGAACTTP